MKKIETCLSPELLSLYNPIGKNVVVVDIFRATSTMVAALASGITTITPVMDLETCKAYAEKGYLIAGERDGKTAPGFPLGNSPLDYLNGNYSGKLAMTTTNGTKAISAVENKASNILIGAFLNIQSTVQTLSKQPEDILILCAGWKGKFNLEDSLYAGALARMLQSSASTDCDATIAMSSLFESNAHRLRVFLDQASHTKRLQNHAIEADIDYCLQIDVNDFTVHYQEGELKKA